MGPTQEGGDAAGKYEEGEGDAAPQERLDLDASGGVDRGLSEPLPRAAVTVCASRSHLSPKIKKEKMGFGILDPRRTSLLSDPIPAAAHDAPAQVRVISAEKAAPLSEAQGIGGRSVRVRPSDGRSGCATAGGA